MKLPLVAAVSLAVVPTALLPQMTVPDSSLKRLAPGLPQKFAFFSTHEDAAASTLDPNDTGTDLKRLGRIAGYVRGRNATGAFSRPPSTGLLTVGTSVILWRDPRSAAASIERDAAGAKRFRGRKLKAGVLVSFDSRKVPALGKSAQLWHIHARGPNGSDQFGTSVTFSLRSFRGNAIVSRADRKSADSLTLRLARELRRRILARLPKR